MRSLSGQQPQSKSEQVKNTNQEEGRPQAVLTQWATKEPELEQGHTRADLSGLDGRPHRWESRPRFVVPLGSESMVRLLAPRLNPRARVYDACAHLCTDTVWRWADGTGFREPGAVCGGSQDWDLGLLEVRRLGTWQSPRSLLS